MNLGQPLIPVSAAAIIRRGQIEIELLSARRTEPANLAGGWEFPGGKWDAGEDAVGALRREIMEELGVDLELITDLPGPLGDGAWPMADRYALYVFICRIPAGQRPELREQHDALRWLPISNPEQVAWLPQDLPPLRALVDWLAAHPAAV